MQTPYTLGDPRRERQRAFRSLFRRPREWNGRKEAILPVEILCLLKKTTTHKEHKQSPLEESSEDFVLKAVCCPGSARRKEGLRAGG
jgi:hypothetical protein